MADISNNTVNPVFTTRGITLTDVTPFTTTNEGKLKIVDHGDWVLYDRELSDAEKIIVPTGALFMQRVSDKVDWYEYSRNPDNFAKSSVIIQATPNPDKTFTVQVASPDRAVLTPYGARVIEVLDFRGNVETIQSRFGGKIYTPKSDVFTDKPVDLKAVAANQKYITETGGITIDGYPVSTDRQSQSMMTSTVLSLQLRPDTVVNWKGPDGKFTVLSRESITGIALLTMQHVATCFSVEAEVVDLIDSGKIKTSDDVVAYFKEHVNTALSTKSA